MEDVRLVTGPAQASPAPAAADTTSELQAAGLSTRRWLKASEELLSILTTSSKAGDRGRRLEQPEYWEDGDRMALGRLTYTDRLRISSDQQNSKLNLQEAAGIRGRSQR
jgi:hypothetical protein